MVSLVPKWQTPPGESDAAAAQRPRAESALPGVAGGLLRCDMVPAYWPTLGGRPRGDNSHLTKLALRSLRGLWRIRFQPGRHRAVLPAVAQGVLGGVPLSTLGPRPQPRVALSISCRTHRHRGGLRSVGAPLSRSIGGLADLCRHVDSGAGIPKCPPLPLLLRGRPFSVSGESGDHRTLAPCSPSRPAEFRCRNRWRALWPASCYWVWE